jgi:hypothetical protein
MTLARQVEKVSEQTGPQGQGGGQGPGGSQGPAGPQGPVGPKGPATGPAGGDLTGPTRTR